MYKIKWDKETGGVQLTNTVSNETLGISPRPVFFEELDLLELDKLGWEYPRVEAPLLWAVNKQYYYKGELVFEAKGANIYDAPQVIFAAGKEHLSLQPVDVEQMLVRNADFMFLLESEAVEFIRDIFVGYSSASKSVSAVKGNQVDFEALKASIEKKTKTKMAIVKEDCDSFDIMPLASAEAAGKRIYQGTKIDRFIASFSGGKDSQVILDLCTRAIPSTEFEVIYSDTGYELPPSLKLYEEVQEYYGKKFPNLKFTTARNHESVLNYWDKIGTPSDTHRWCCTVMKTAPLYRMLKVEGTNKQAKVLAFEGVRAEESTRRGSYNRIGKGVKHTFVTNARPILHWSTTEVFLYLFTYNLPINPAYRLGKPRVGCILCPFGSPWDDMIVNRRYNAELKPFIGKLEKVIENRKIPNGSQFISERLWKLRSSGKDLSNRTSIFVKSGNFEWIVSVKNSKQSLLTWLPVIGKFTFRESDNTADGEIYFTGNVYRFSVEYGMSESDYTFVLYDNNNIRLRSLLRRIFHKNAYCINCESCEIECPTGALSVYPRIDIKLDKCIHCFKCLDFHDTGCIVADSLISPGNSSINISNMKISKYGTFGIQQEWMEQYLTDATDFFHNCALGTKQIPSFKAWLKDAMIMDEKGNLTEFGELCSKIMDNSDDILWAVILVNLSYNSALFQWYNATICFNRPYTRKEFEELAIEAFQSAFKSTTIKYALQALVQCFKYTKIGADLGQFEYIDTKGGIFERKGSDDIPAEAIAYSIYKYAFAKDIKVMRVSDFYRSEETTGPFREFGISKNELVRKLNSLTMDKNPVLTAQLNMGLDHITLRDDLTPILALRQLV